MIVKMKLQEKIKILFFSLMLIKTYINNYLINFLFKVIVLKNIFL